MSLIERNFILINFQRNIEKQHELYNLKKFKAMRDLIVMDIKIFIEILRKRGTSIDTQCVKNMRKKKMDIQPTCVIKQEIDISNNLLETQHTFNTIYQQDPVQEMDYLFTANDVSVSVINSLIHVNIK